MGDQARTAVRRQRGVSRGCVAVMTRLAVEHDGSLTAASTIAARICATVGAIE